MAKNKPLSEHHVSLAEQLEFLSQSPAYKRQKVIVWVTGDADLMKAADDLSDRGYLGIEKERVGTGMQSVMSVQRERIPEVLAFVTESFGATA